MGIDPRQLRDCLGHFATGVTVVTCHTPDGTVHGATVNAFTAVSLTPPLVMVCVRNESRMSAYLKGVPFAVNVLSRDQQELAMHFAGKPWGGDIAWRSAADEIAPAIDGCLATISCKPWRAYDGGDHTLFLGEVQQIEHAVGKPLLFHRGQFHDLHFESMPAHWAASGDAPAATTWIGEVAAALKSRI